MSKKGRKIRQLSEHEVYRDAACILEEVLENSLGKKSFKSTDSANTNTCSSSGYYDASRESLDLWLKDDASKNYSIERSQTMPSSFKLEEKDDFTLEDIKEYMKKKSDVAIRRHSGSDTSCESDAAIDDRIGSPLRRKKSFFKRAKERFLISVRRDGRKDEDEDVVTKEKRRKKKRNKDDKDKRKSSKIEENGDDELNDVEMRSGNRKRSNTNNSINRRSSILDTIRRSFRPKRKSTSTISESQSADPVVVSKDGSRDNSKVDIPLRVPEVPFVTSPSIIDLDDIQYIDEDRDKSKEMDNKIDELPKPKGSRTKPAPPPPIAQPLHPTFPLGDGHTGIPDVSNHEMDDETDSPVKKEEESPFGEKSDDEKNAIFEKIAIKLMDMADNMEKIKSSSDTSDGKPVITSNHSSSVDPQHLTALEQELLECLRVGGDRLSQSFDDPVQVVVEKHRKQAYSRFNDTLRKGLGDEISWNQLSLIYQTATGAVKAAGAGTQLALRVKDMTQQYVGDMFAKWIVKEGGWDSMLSESDSEVY